MSNRSKSKVLELWDNEVINPEDLTGYKKVYEVSIYEIRDMYKHATVVVLANSKKEAEELTKEQYEEWDYNELMDWSDEECTNRTEDVDAQEVKDNA